MNDIFIDGRLGGDAEVRTTRDGKPYVRFSVANNVYYKGEERTYWYDVTCYDPFIVEKRSKILTKGTYVFVRGSFVPDPKPYNGKLWINYNVTATMVEVPRVGRNQALEQPQMEETPPEISVYTANTQSAVIAPQPAVIAPQPAPAPAAASVAPSMAPLPTYAPMDFSDSDDLPF